MNSIAASPWTPADYCLTEPFVHAQGHIADLARALYRRVCRTDFSVPGFCLCDLGIELNSEQFRRLMIDLVHAMGEIHRVHCGRDLAIVSAARFDQQVTTKPHRDGGPDESFLMLGYEPSQIRASLSMSDYARCALDLGLTPAQFLEKHNPMFAVGMQLLCDYTTRVDCFSNRHYQLLLINNSIAAYSDAAPAWQGVLHTAAIENPDESVRRVVNSIMVASTCLGSPHVVSSNEQEAFVQTKLVRRRGYDKPELDESAER